MKKELALISGAVVIVLLFYPVTRFTGMSLSWTVILMLPLTVIILYSMYHAVTLLFNKDRKKAIIFVSLLVVAVFVSFQFVMLMIGLTIPIIA